MLLLALLACTPEPTVEAPPVAPPVVAQPEQQADMRYVMASRLNLRSAPGGAKSGRLSINTPLELLATEGDQVKVRVNNGKEGWVPASYLTAEPLTLDRALRETGEAQNPEERLSWAQRAAALDGRSKEALTSLAEAYRAAGKPALADKVAKQADWPDDLLLAGAHQQRDGQLSLEWSWQFDDEGLGYDDTVLTEAQMARQGVNTGDAVWVLPSQGPAVKGEVTGMRHHVFNECGGVYGYTVQVDAQLPEGETPVAWTLKPPPASWSSPAPPVDVAAVEGAVRAKLPAGDFTLHIAPYGAGARVVAAQEKGTDEWDMPEFVVVTYDVVDGVASEQSRVDDYLSYIGYSHPIAGRDLDGDGNLDLINGGLCEQTLLDHLGDQRMQTMGLCCGC